VSEYQYYEFLAMDRPLTSAQIKEVQEFSSRATITPTSFINEYNYSGFRGKPETFLTKYFDAMVYVTNWGTHQFMFRVPRDLVDLKALEPYCTEETLDIKPIGANLLFDFDRPEQDGGDWEDGRVYMASLAGLRAEVMTGDFRALYLAWLSELETGGMESDTPAPPVPPGLKTLTASQKALVDFLGMDGEIVKMVAEMSSDAAPQENLNIEQALKRIPPVEKDRWLQQIIESNEPHAGMRLRLKLQSMVLPRQATPESVSSKTAGELYEQYQQHVKAAEERNRQLAEVKRRKQQTEAGTAREKHLDTLSQNEPDAWRKVDQMIGLRTDEEYKNAVTLLVDLRDLSQRPGGNAQEFQRQLARRLAEHERKANFIKRISKAGLNSP
jgi:hypothetical protein